MTWWSLARYELLRLTPHPGEAQSLLDHIWLGVGEVALHPEGVAAFPTSQTSIHPGSAVLSHA